MINNSLLLHMLVYNLRQYPKIIKQFLNNGIPPILIGGMSSAHKPPIAGGIPSIKNH